MIVYGLWFGGGGSWAHPELPRDLEMFDSIAEAREQFLARKEIGAHFPMPFKFVTRPPADGCTPTVGDDSQMQLFFRDPTDERDPYPDRLMTFGPRGGVVVEPC